MQVLFLSFLMVIIGCDAENKDEDPSSTDSGDIGEADADNPDENDLDADADDADTDGDTDADADADADDDPECETVMGTFSGVVIRAIIWETTEGPEPNARVTVRLADMSDEPITILANEEGEFTSPLPESTYRVQATSNDGCESEWEEVEIVACETVTNNLRLYDCMDGGSDADADSGGDSGGDDGDATD